ncbi:MAG: GNAT family N-acetyltransferase [Aeromicrobium sp.]|uniref:GNAT family N-acetyltransferase n=1 Tax=Aeromicrobium sp. TaxID=1871063 RepID=UPI0039E359BF
MTVVVRARTAADAGGLLAALRPVHERDGYPLYATHLTTGWLYDGITDAWVAADGDRLLGHIALAHDERGSHVTRFFVAVDARGSGAGSALLSTVEAWADERAVELTLDVVEHNTDARALYERHGWRHVDTVTATWVREEPPWPQAFVYRRDAQSRSTSASSSSPQPMTEPAGNAIAESSGVA